MQSLPEKKGKEGKFQRGNPAARTHMHLKSSGDSERKHGGILYPHSFVHQLVESNVKYKSSNRKIDSFSSSVSFQLFFF
jgi:hypothetical protein